MSTMPNGVQQCERCGEFYSFSPHLCPYDEVESVTSPRSRTPGCTAIALLCLIIIAMCVVGCASNPRPAKTVVTPGQSEIEHERTEQQPSESRLLLTSEPPSPPPPFVIRIIVEAPEPPQTCPAPPAQENPQ